MHDAKQFHQRQLKLACQLFDFRFRRPKLNQQQWKRANNMISANRQRARQEAKRISEQMALLGACSRNLQAIRPLQTKTSFRAPK